MRMIWAISLLLAACSKQSAEPSLTSGTFAGEGRDRLCIAGESGALRAGLIAYGRGDVNCSASGSLQQAGRDWVLVPKGEGDCRIPIVVSGDAVRIGLPPAACDYYCGPGATMAAKTFNRAKQGEKATDMAGDPLC